MSAVGSLVRRWEAAEASGDDAATAALVADDFLAVGAGSSSMRRPGGPGTPRGCGPSR